MSRTNKCTRDPLGGRGEGQRLLALFLEGMGRLWKDHTEEGYHIGKFKKGVLTHHWEAKKGRLGAERYRIDPNEARKEPDIFVAKKGGKSYARCKKT